MKKSGIIILTILMLVLFSASAFAAGELYSFENTLGGLTTVSNTLSSGGSVSFGDGYIDLGLELNGGGGLFLGTANGDFTVSAMVKQTVSGNAKNIFFKNMGSKSSEKWTGVVLVQGIPTLWANGGGFSWSTLVKADESALNNWSYISYTEKDGVGSLYVNGELIGSASVINTGGDIYAAATYWSDDAPTGAIDELYFDNGYAATAEEISEMYTELAVKNISVPSKAISNLSLPSSIGSRTLTWKSDNEAVITSDGVVTRGDEDETVNLTLYIDGVESRTYAVKVLKNASKTNSETVLSYVFDSSADGVVEDLSGNGNHGIIHGGLVGCGFDGYDDYVEMPNGILADLDEFTITMHIKAQIEQTHQFTFCFGNSSTQYFFLNTSRPTTNTIRLALTKSGSGGEADIRSIPGIRKGEEAYIAVTVNGSEAAMYVNGVPVAGGDLGFSPKELGETVCNWLAKSPYDDPYFCGDIYEFSIYSYEMSASDISAMHSASDDGGSYIDDISLNSGSLDVNLNRDCVVSAIFFDSDGNTLGSAVKKASNDKLSVSFACSGWAQAEIAAFDGSTGIIKDKRAVSIHGGIIAYTTDGGNVKLVNTTDDEAEVFVIAAAYSGDALSDVITGTAVVAGGSFEVISFPIENAKLMVWTSVSEMQPVKNLD